VLVRHVTYDQLHRFTVYNSAFERFTFLDVEHGTIHEGLDGGIKGLDSMMFTTRVDSRDPSHLFLISEPKLPKRITFEWSWDRFIPTAGGFDDRFVERLGDCFSVVIDALHAADRLLFSERARDWATSICFLIAGHDAPEETFFRNRGIDVILDPVLLLPGQEKALRLAVLKLILNILAIPMHGEQITLPRFWLYAVETYGIIGVIRALQHLAGEDNPIVWLGYWIQKEIPELKNKKGFQLMEPATQARLLGTHIEMVENNVKRYLELLPDEFRYQTYDSERAERILWPTMLSAQPLHALQRAA